jgi:WxL interacting protein linking bacterial and host surfaces
MVNPLKLASVTGVSCFAGTKSRYFSIYKMFTLIVINLTFIVHVSAQTIQTVGVNSKSKNKSTKGISVSPAHFNLNLNPGDTKTYKITVNNSSNYKKQFQVNVYDFNMNGRGKSNFLPAGEGKYSLAKWLNISPTFIEIKPRERKQVAFTITVPTSDSGFKSAWSIIMLEEQKPRLKINDVAKNGNTIALGIVPTFAFGVFVYQNPPNVLTNKIEITNFTFKNTTTDKTIYIEAQNQGDGIAYCTSYIDLTNLDTGRQTRLKVKRFTIMPDLIRDFIFELPSKMPQGKYLAVGVLDYGSADEIQAAKLEFEIN